MAAKKKAAKRKSRAKVKKPTKAQRETRRDVTVALGLVMAAQERVQKGEPVFMADLNQLAGILADIDARTGRRDPSKRGIKPPETVNVPDAEVVHTHPGSASHVDGNEPSQPEAVPA